VQIGSQAMADRYTYVPLIGIFIIIAWGIPELMAGWRLKRKASAITALVFLSILMGFVIFHISEKYLYQHVKNKKELLKDLKELHVVGFFIDNFIIGFILVTTLKISGFNGIIIILPIILHTISSSMAMEHIHERARTKINKIILSLSPIIGALVALLIIIEGIYLALIIAFLVGMLLKTVNRDVVPRKEKGYPHLFILGVLIVIISWLLII